MSGEKRPHQYFLRLTPYGKRYRVDRDTTNADSKPSRQSTDYLGKSTQSGLAKPMAYTKRRIGRRGRTSGRVSRRGRTRRSASTKGLAAKVAKLWEAAVVERPVKHLLWSDTSVTGGTSLGFNSTALQNSAPQQALLNGIVRVGTATNSTVQTRLADYCYITSIKLKMFTKFGTAVSGDVYLNWILYVQKQPQGQSLSGSQFAADYFGTTTPVSNSIPNKNNQDVGKRYRILKRGRIFMKETVSGVLETHCWGIHWFSKKAIRTSYVLGATGSIASIDTGAIYLMMWTDQNQGTGSTGILTQIEGNTYFRDQV